MLKTPVEELCLVEIGDKKRFIYEVIIHQKGLVPVLDKLIGVTYNVKDIRSRDELAKKYKELLMYSEIPRTPFTIGGKVLAYTLYGVDNIEAIGD